MEEASGDGWPLFHPICIMDSSSPLLPVSHTTSRSLSNRSPHPPFPALIIFVHYEEKDT